jgi:methionine-rich copper-binding protein CopC
MGVLGRGASRAAGVRAGVAFVLAILAICCGASSAQAHARLTWASPEPESRANGSPAQLQLHFLLPAVPDERTTISVMTPSGRDIASGDTLVTGLGVAQRLAKSSEAGWYAVTYHVGLSDGHVSQGEFRFLVAAHEGSAVSRWLWIVGSLATLVVLAVLAGARRRAAAAPAGSESMAPNGG